jgi:hypothetical protein
VALDVVGTIKNTNPYFSVTSSIATSNSVVPFASTATKFKWDTEYLDNSNSFNTVTGEFTAPVAGYYFFSANIFFTISNNTASNSYGFWQFYKNDIVNSYTFFSPNTSSNYLNYTNTSGSHIISLNVGDRVSIYYKGTPYQGGGGYSNFNGRFLG